MKILMIEGSPHKNGSSNLLADNFIQGAKEAGHEVSIFDAAHAKLYPCVACNACQMAGPCWQKDDMESVKDRIRESDMVAFVTPLYYFDISTQLKMVIDRFYSFHMELTDKKLKTALIVAANNDQEQVMDAVKPLYMKICNYMNFESKGMILGTGCGTVEMTKGTEFPQKAYEFGKSL